jgi:hypothetical protein
MCITCRPFVLPWMCLDVVQLFGVQHRPCSLFVGSLSQAVQRLRCIAHLPFCCVVLSYIYGLLLCSTIDSQRVRCPFGVQDPPSPASTSDVEGKQKALGCEWTGTRAQLDKHVLDCGFASVTCGGCQLKMMRSDLSTHARESCLARNVSCEYCGAVMEARAQKNHVDSTCSHYPMLCPNYCVDHLAAASDANSTGDSGASAAPSKVRMIPRGLMKRHLDSECERAEIGISI